jgi:NAD(P)H-hydrate repair Nnr-like enzyme with NAD(P)H-hydrate epimerase domain
MPTHPHHRDLYTVEQLRGMERDALTALNISGYDLMRRAASAALNSLRRHWPQVRHVTIYCGPGNNGGDGFLLGVLAREAGLQVELVALSDKAHGDAALGACGVGADGGRVHLWSPDVASLRRRIAGGCAVRHRAQSCA